jgi:hypothetical protein
VLPSRSSVRPAILATQRAKPATAKLGTRLKRAGMQWTVSGAHPIRALERSTWRRERDTDLGRPRAGHQATCWSVIQSRCSAGDRILRKDRKKP